MEERDDIPQHESPEGAGASSSVSPGSSGTAGSGGTTTPGAALGEDAPGASGMAAIVAPTFNAILAPSECFEVLDEKPTRAWWIYLWTGLVMLGLGVWNLSLTRSAFTAMTRTQMEASGQEMSAEQIRQAQQFNETLATVTTFASPVLLLAQFLIVAAVIWLVASLVGKSGGFSRAFAVTMGAAVVHPMTYSIYASIILHMNPPEIRRAQDFALMTPTAGLDLLFDRAELASWVLPILQRIDLFNIWWAVLVVIGAQKVLGMRRGQAITVAVVVWGLGTAFAAVGGLVQGMAG